MSTPILTTKLYIPPLQPNIVLRPRLIERLAAWLSLDENDNDLTRFLMYLIAALQTLAAISLFAIPSLLGIIGLWANRTYFAQ